MSRESTSDVMMSTEKGEDPMRSIAEKRAPRLFAIVEERGKREGSRVAGYGLAYADHVDVNSVEGDFHLMSQSPERARQLFEISARSRGVRTHLVWLTGR
ncbi:hypothetical protein ACIGNX_23935 [Actinosynnema sp. NPDC053489]|uniref:hypothetical protein n=1 Tax=Actinosynnema sp. NPDC053489 TaxID=3363916 RepID=UPI0037CA2175